MKTLINTIVLALVMSFSNVMNAKNSYVSVTVNTNNKLKVENIYGMKLNYDKSKNSWLSLDMDYVKTITFVLDDNSVVTLKRTGTTVKRTLWISEYGPMVSGNTKSINETYNYALSKKNAKLLSEHDIKKISFNDSEYDANFCLYGFYYILDNKYDAKKNHTKSDYDWYK